jgi:hypothetical protein
MHTLVYHAVSAIGSLPPGRYTEAVAECGELGEMEASVAADLSLLPDALARGALAIEALVFARMIDRGELPPREAIAAGAQIRQCMVQLHEWAPGEVKDDKTDKAQERRERGLLRVVPDQ